MEGESSGHDWWHVKRVWENALEIASAEGADLYVVQLAALLHDLADWKVCGGSLKAGSRAARKWLLGLQLNEPLIQHVAEISGGVSYKGAGVPTAMASLEGQVVQDADRLDAMGAIGIARTFAYGGSRQREIVNPEIVPVFHRTFEEYKSGSGPSINHFYEKLLLLKDLMNTAAARRMAEARHRFMEDYLRQFWRECRKDGWVGFGGTV
jgi:uncharacterized protein